MKDKTIISPVIQSRYTCSNWCVALLGREANAVLVNGGVGLVNMESKYGEQAGLLLHPSKPPRQGYCLGSNFWRAWGGWGGLLSNRLLWAPIRIEDVEKKLPLMSRLYQQGISKSQWVFSQDTPCDLLPRPVRRCLTRIQNRNASSSSTPYVKTC